MLELGTGQPAAENLVKDISEAEFMAEVVDGSAEVPVIVDFWAPWCGPCKTLGPMLEDAVKAAKGAVRMVKVNVDEAQNIAGQLRIQSIPTVYAFYKGQPLDGFQGALPQSELNAFIDRVVQASGGDASGGLDDAVAAAEEMLEQGAAVDAAQTFAAILEEEPNHAAAYGGLVRAHIAMDDLDQAEAILNGAPAEISSAPELEAAHAQLQLARQAADAGPIAELTAAVESDPANNQARFDLAQAIYAAGDAEGAVDQLLEIFRRDREWNDGAAKAQLFTIFEALKPNDPVALNGRRKLSSMIFA
ncbi:thioredoxin [Mameliella sediminis]|uniref:thioredoxin n=1 Tax=Mameliella sediminis TaxID=2836866 RepID=UPI001C47FDA3|nr:thioredoxin [Mameliella sediminis]MBY6115050.1 thioredoxin [Antarctobacter heliothermus]MBY6145065.1 thioredoxin [Mameliella alba]MBV7396172.1 thioredoxin [Mameliella sediminis]MBY6160582.1 thioredoxin [Mameliella alba]MBY6169052.1 thioredoxin [Mameliella alba]